MIKQRHYYKRVQNNLYTNADKYSYMENLQMKQNKQTNNQPWMLLSPELETGFIAFLEWNEWKKDIMFDHLFHNSHEYSH